MQSLAFLWFDLQMTQRYLSDITFGSARPDRKSDNKKASCDRAILFESSNESEYRMLLPRPHLDSAR
jgi:hypothetical protein